MRGVADQLLGSFQQAALALSQALRTRAGREHLRGAGQMDADERDVLNLTRAQLGEVSVLVEEILARWRGTRVQLERFCQRLTQEEQQIQQAILTPLADLRQTLEAIYGRGGAA